MIHVKTHVVARRNARGGRSAQEHLVAPLRCLYRRAVSDGLIKEADNPGTEDRQAAAPDDHPTVTAWRWPSTMPGVATAGEKTKCFRRAGLPMIRAWICASRPSPSGPP